MPINHQRLNNSNALTQEWDPSDWIQKKWQVNPRTSYVLDPLQAAQQLNRTQPGEISSTLDKLAAEIFNLQQAIYDHAIRQGKIPNSIGMEIVPNEARYSRKNYPNLNDQSGELGTAVEFIGLKNTPMMDWDTPDPFHPDASVSVRHLGDVEDLAREYVNKHPQSHLKLYQTPGGYRAWELGETFPVNQFQRRYAQLNVDPLYASFNKYKNQLSGYKFPATYNSRISHKPGRSDWVAQPIATIAGNQAIVNPRSRQLVNVLHDEPIKQHYLGTSGVSPDAMNLLLANLPSTSQLLQNELRRRFGL